MGHAFPLRDIVRPFVRPVVIPLALLALLANGGCGRRGPLELPPGAPNTQSPAAAEAQQARVLNDEDNPGLIQSPNQVIEATPEAKQQQLTQRSASPVAPHPINAPPVEKRSTFFLDPLL